MTDDFITIAEAARELSRSVSSTWRIVKSYNLPTFKRPLDRKTYVRHSDIMRLGESFAPRRQQAGQS